PGSVERLQAASDAAVDLAELLPKALRLRLGLGQNGGIVAGGLHLPRVDLGQPATHVLFQVFGAVGVVGTDALVGARFALVVAVEGGDFGAVAATPPALAATDADHAVTAIATDEQAGKQKWLHVPGREVGA